MTKIISTVGLFAFFLLNVIFIACKDTNSRQTSPPPTVDTSTIATPKVEPTPNSVTLYAWVDQLRVREQPDKNAKVVEEVAEGGELQFLNEKSDFSEKITLRGTAFNEPWLKVQTTTGNIGWVYGGGVKFYAPKIDLAPAPYDPCFALYAEDKWEQGQACTEKEQEKQLKKEKRWVTESPEKLDILLLDGTTKTFNRKDIDEPEDLTYEYRYYIPQMGYHVLKVYGYEWSGFLLVNDKSGKTIELTGFPKPSPDFRYLVCTNFDLVAGFEFNGIQMFGFTDSGLALIFSQEMTDFGPLLPIWLDEKTVEIVFRPSEENPEVKDKKVQLVLKESGSWELEE